MKKLIALALALLMLLASVACAESARVMTYSNPYLQLTTGGDAREVDVSSLSLRLASGTPDGVPTLQAELFKKGRMAERGLVQYIDGKVYIQAGGLSNTYAADVSQYGPQAQSAVEKLFGGLDSLMDFKLPAIGGVKLGKIDMTAVAPLLGTLPTTDAKGTKTANVDVPYFMVKQLLTMASQYKDAVPAAAQAYTGPLFSLLEGMVQSDSGFALKGKITNSSKRSVADMDVYSVTGGVTAEAPSAKVKLTSKKNLVKLTVDMLQGESAVNAVTLSLTSEPKNAAISLSLDVMSLFVLNGSLRNENGAQAVALELAAMGQKLSLAADYGTAGDMDYVNLKLSAPNRIDLSASLQASADGNGGSAGTAAVSAQTYGDAPVGVQLTGDVAEGRDEVEFHAITKTGGAVDLLHMTAEQGKQLTDELNRLVNKFLSRSRINA